MFIIRNSGTTGQVCLLYATLVPQIRTYVNVHIRPVYTFSAELLLIEVTDDRDYEDVFLITSTVVPRTNTLVEVTLEKFTEYPVPDFFSDLVSFISIDCY